MTAIRFIAASLSTALVSFALASGQALAGACEVPFHATTLDAHMTNGIQLPREMRLDSSVPCPANVAAGAQCYAGKYKSMPMVPDSLELELFVKAYQNETIEYDVSVAGFSSHETYVGSCAADSPWFIQGDIYLWPGSTLSGTFRMMTRMQ